MNQMVTFSNSEQINRFRPSQEEIDRRYANVRAAMEAHGLERPHLRLGQRGFRRLQSAILLLDAYGTAPADGLPRY